MPLLTPRPTHALPESPAPARPPGVLVVDGDAHVRAALHACLKHLGCLVWSAASGAEAVELYSIHGGSVRLVLLDLHLPGGDGPHTLAQLRRLDPEVKSCYMSADLPHSGRGLVRNVPVLRKPFDARRLVPMLRDLATAGQG